MRRCFICHTPRLHILAGWDGVAVQYAHPPRASSYKKLRSSLCCAVLMLGLRACVRAWYLVSKAVILLVGPTGLDAMRGQVDTYREDMYISPSPACMDNEFVVHQLQHTIKLLEEYISIRTLTCEAGAVMAASLSEVCEEAMSQPGVQGVVCVDEQGLCLHALGIVPKASGSLAALATHARALTGDDASVVSVVSSANRVVISKNEGITTALFLMPDSSTSS
eukprot:6214381-Pleurochrysis_carterae.AAC.1